MELLAAKINESIKESIEYKNVKEAEKKMLEDSDTLILLTLYQQKQDEYNDALRFKEYGANVNKIKKELADIKYKVDINDYVKEYNSCYKKLKELLDKVSKNILESIE